MSNKWMAGAGMIVLAAAVLIGVLAFDSTAGAQNADTYEYGYLLPVPRLESYEIDVSRWAGTAEEKKYLETHVFVYAEGSSNFDRQVNCLRRLNELAAQGWEMADAQVGLIRRKR